MMTFANSDLFLVGIAVAAASMLGLSLFLSDPRSGTARAFLFFSGMSISWGIVNFFSAQAQEPSSILWLVRLTLFFAAWYSFSFILLSLQFPNRNWQIRPKILYPALIWTAIISIVSLTPLDFVSVTAVSPAVVLAPGPGIFLFGITVFLYNSFSVAYLVRRFIRSNGEERRQLEFVCIGLFITLVLIVVFNFIFPAFFGISALVPLGALFMLPFIAGTAYSVLHYRLFNSRVAFFGALLFVLASAIFFDVLLSSSFLLIIYRVGELVLVLLAGSWLIRSMVREFELEEELKEINVRQEGLIHFIGHEVKGFLTKAQGTFSLLVDGDLGQMPDTMRPFVERALQDTKDGVTSVSDILKASNMKKGTVTFAKESFDLKALVEDSVEKARQTAEGKGLKLSLSVEGDGFQMTGDKGEIGDHVLRNLIDNAVNYTPSGSIEVSLKKAGGKYVFAVKDTGVGITPEDKARLFTEGGHGKESQKVNVHSTGYGLFIAKQVVDAHGGTISASSAGPGTGSTFTCEFPILN